ncbi:hypothetical protein [uncultured Polaribacter sp.]|uniref:hypothetical protein n=1 Tax=uncultured Polaribacter sp. TaxID=174711 RepID=UPI002625F7CF|nr:hypothetical protein [uncultured Polaribacter sp.]
MKQITILLLAILIFSCKSNKKEIVETIQEIPEKSTAKKHASAIDVNADFEDVIADWKELNTVKHFLKKFEKVSPNEALSNALELRDLVKSLKDSIKPAIFDIPSFKARVNVLENETLRLADLTLIPAITPTEINSQVNKTIGAFSAVNSKINSILSKKRFEDEIDIKVDFIGIDSTMIDSTTRKSINLKNKEELEKKKNKQ